MNASEKRICATPSLMQLDEQIGEVGRRAALHQASFKSDQRAFRKALKTCKGEEGCLTATYEKRIAELQSFLDTLPAASEGEVAELAEASEKAEAKRDAQTDTRARIAEKLEQADAQAEPEIIYAPAEPVQLPADNLPTESTTALPPLTDVAPATASTVQKKADEPGLWTWVFWGVIALMLLGAFVQWLFAAVRRCPNCTKWWAGQVYDRDRESYTDYETKTFVDEHRNRRNQLTGTTTRKRQVKVRVSHTTDYLRCDLCQHEWVLSSTSRSS